MTSSKTWIASALAMVTSVVAIESDASACGGCFSSNETPTVVSDHRMILSIGRQRSTLYDQIRYQGSPDAFAWVLPISGPVEVGLGSDAVFESLDTQTQTQIIAPMLNCAGPPFCGGGGASSSSGSSGSSPSAGAEDAGVEVTSRDVVGPYETVQLKATDPKALETWLADNGFAVPADVKPVVDQYVTEHFDFLALKLLPGKDVHDMRPVRVTSTGANVVLPLRMVAAGAGATLGVSLWVVGEGRYVPQNFPTFTVKEDEIVWDFATNKSNYSQLRAQKSAAGEGKAWEIESATTVSVDNFTRYLDIQGQSYLPEKDARGNVTKSASAARDEDLATLFAGVTGEVASVTRLRADLSHAALATDLAVIASNDVDPLTNVRRVTKYVNAPECPVYPPCPAESTSGAAPSSSGSGEDSASCTTSARSPAESAPGRWLAAGSGFAILAAIGIVRRRRRLRDE